MTGGVQLRLRTLVRLLIAVGIAAAFASPNHATPPQPAVDLVRQSNDATEARSSAATRTIRRLPRAVVVAADGRSGGNGSASDPIDLATALSGGGDVVPGDTLWLRGGTYHGPFTSRISGAPDRPIEIRSCPAERPVLDGVASPGAAVLTINGSDTTFRGFEVTNSDARRDRERGIGLNVFGPRTRLIDLIVHDTGNGIGLWSPAIESELYGSIVYNVGWEENGYGKGHAVYVQNETGIKRLRENVLFNAYGFGIHAYSERGRIDFLDIERNVSFNHGIVSPRREAKADILVGGWQVAASPTIVGNFSYYGAGDEGRGADVGYRAGCTGARIEGNYLAGGTPLRLRRCDDATITGNRLYGHVADDLAESFPHNEYSASPPERNDVFVLPNAFEHGRATVVVFNWERRRSIQADISAAGFVNGETIVVRDVQDYFGSPVAELSYRTGEPLDIPLGAASAASPIGGAPVAHTPLTFAVFSVERRPATEGDIPQLSPCGGRGERP